MYGPPTQRFFSHLPAPLNSHRLFTAKPIPACTSSVLRSTEAPLTGIYGTTTVSWSYSTFLSWPPTISRYWSTSLTRRYWSTTLCRTRAIPGTGQPPYPGQQPSPGLVNPLIPENSHPRYWSSTVSNHSNLIQLSRPNTDSPLCFNLNNHRTWLSGFQFGFTCFCLSDHVGKGTECSTWTAS